MKTFNTREKIDRKPSVRSVAVVPRCFTCEARPSNVCEQCNPTADPLLADYHFDTACLTLQTLKEKYNLLPEQLKAFQLRVPTAFPWSSCYEVQRQNVNRLFNVFPLMIALPQSTRQVAESFKFARRHGLPFRLRAGGHSYEAYSLIRGMVIDQSHRSAVEIDSKNMIATIQAGADIGPTVMRLWKEGHFFIPTGTCPNVGFAGLTLGGGFGFFTRQFGLTCDNLLEVQMILASGRTVRASAKRNRSLFFASQGGGGNNYGIVTEFKFRLHLVNQVYFYQLNYPFEVVEQALDKWQRWAPFQVDQLGSEFNVVCDAKTGDLSVKIIGQFNSPDRAELIRTLKRVAKVTDDANAKIVRPRIVVRQVTYPEVARIFADTTHRQPFLKVKNYFVREFFPKTALALVRHWMGIAPKGAVFELDAFGGAVNRVPPTATAFVHRDSLFLIHFRNAWSLQQDTQAHIQWMTDFYNALKPFSAHQSYVNGIDRDVCNYLQEYYGENLPRLVRIKQRYDPDNVFHFPQSIPTRLSKIANDPIPKTCNCFTLAEQLNQCCKTAPTSKQRKKH